MANKIERQDLLPPPWIRHPSISPCSIGWRMGEGEDYRYHWHDWYDALTEGDKKHYQALFPAPLIWRNFYRENKEDETESEETLFSHGVMFWHPHGAMQYSREGLQLKQQETKALSYTFFWKPGTEDYSRDCLGQWHTSAFNADGDQYSCAEQYMMAEKARVFGDKDVEKEIMATPDPKAMKALGKKVRHFDQSVWNKVKYSIVLNGNYHKFSQNERMRAFLFSTGDTILVEASPLDKIWGIGLAAENPDAADPSRWRGQNLLGFALMEVRDELRRIYTNADKIAMDRSKR